MGKKFNNFSKLCNITPLNDFGMINVGELRAKVIELLAER